MAARVNGNLALKFGPIALTSYAGLELFGRYLQQSGFNALVRDVFVRSGLGGHFGPVAVVRVLTTLDLATLAVDIDGTVVSTGLQVERAFRGFNPHHRKVLSSYPILARLAETTHVLRVKNRSGNVRDGKAGVPFLREV